MGTISARAMQVDATDTSCNAIRTSAIGIGGTQHQFTVFPPAAQTQSGSSYVTFSSLNPGLYTIAPAVPPGYVIARYCWQRATIPTTGETQSADLVSGDTLTWDVGYTLGKPWVQASGGDVYASGMLQSFVPVSPPLPAPRVFIKDGATGGYPGVATYGGNCNFDSASAPCGGKTWVSSKNWLVDDPSPATNFYQLFYDRFEAPTMVMSGTTLNTQLSANTKPYYYDGNLTVNGTGWTIAAGQDMIVFVSGNLALNTTMDVSSGGFLAFIVKGNITVAPSVASLDGMYVTSPAGTFSTGTGAVPFVGTGMFVAGNFSLQRDLGDVPNTTTPSELFVYNPQILFTMPEKMKKLSVKWQEVAP